MCNVSLCKKRWYYLQTQSNAIRYFCGIFLETWVKDGNGPTIKLFGITILVFQEKSTGVMCENP